jgi:glycolate oxidase
VTFLKTHDSLLIVSDKSPQTREFPAKKNRDTIIQLQRLVRKENVLTDKVELVCYSYDATCYSSLPDVVVFPRNSGEVSKIMRLANRKRIPVTPRGAGTSLSGGPVPANAGIVVVLARMSRILEFDEDNLTITCEAGLALRDLNKFLRKKGFSFPIDPGSSEAATLGGMMGENASGMHSLEYGRTMDRVLSLEVVLPTGEIVEVGSRCFKCASGYNLKELFIGSEGTLGIVTKATLRIAPIPDNYAVALLPFNTTVEAGRAISKVVKKGIQISALEFMDKNAIDVARSFTGLPLPNAAAMVLIECVGSEKEVQSNLARVAEILRSEGAFDVKISGNREEADQLWYARKATYGAISRIRPMAIQGDPVVPVSRLPEFLARLDSISKKYSVQIVSYGHAADGNLHPTVMVDERNPEEMTRARRALAEIYRSALKLGGTLTGEHGIGAEKHEYFNLEWSDKVIAVMKETKVVFDPNNIMNPGKWI